MSKETIGPYKIISKAGEGAFGKVWKVHHEEKDEFFAIKEISKKKITPELMENLQREVEISFKLDHKNITKCFNTLESKKNYYLIFEFCEGGDLEKYLEKVTRPDIKIALSIMKQLREVFKYLVGQKVLHRDIKLENILLKEKDASVVKLSDFGCSKENAMGETLCGTPKYMALEVMENTNNYDYKADMWSLGLVFWELLYGIGSFPFSFKSRDVLKNEIKNYSGKNLRFPKLPKYPTAFYDFFTAVLDVSPQLRMDSEEFYNHPIFGFDGSEEEIQIALEFVDGQKESGETNQNGGGQNGLSSSQTIFGDIKKAYNLKVLEVNLIKGVCEELLEFLKNDWSAGFFSRYIGLIIILIKKALTKADVAYKTLSKGTNAFKLDGFEEFVKQPEEIKGFKDELGKLRKELKKLDDEVYSKLLAGGYESDYLENVNRYFYKKGDSEGKTKFIGGTLKGVSSKFKEFIPDYEHGRFEKIVKRVTIVLKGKVVDNLNIFY